MSESAAPPEGPRFALARLITGQVCLHACMSGMRLASPLLALREGYSPLAVGFLLALFALMQVFLAVQVLALRCRGHPLLSRLCLPV